MIRRCDEVHRSKQKTQHRGAKLEHSTDALISMLRKSRDYADALKPQPKKSEITQKKRKRRATCKRVKVEAIV